jgi:hypothetical protein
VNPFGYCFYWVEGDDGIELHCLDSITTDEVMLTDNLYYLSYVNSHEGIIVYNESDSDCFISVKGGKGTEVDKQVISAQVSDDGKTLYTVEADDGDDKGELVSYTIGEDGVSNRTTLANDVLADQLYNINGFICYMTDYDSDDNSGALIVWDGTKMTKLADCVKPWGSPSEVEDGFVFFADTKILDNEGALYLYNGEIAVEVASDVYCSGFVEFDCGLLYLTDFDDYDGGTLYQWNGKDKIKIASDVQAVIPVK